MIWLALLAQLAMADILLEDEPIVGGTVAIDVVNDLSQPVSGATVRAIRRPGLPGERDVAVGLTDARGRVYWTPKQSGTQVLRARDHEIIVHVASRYPPVTPLILMGTTGLLGLSLLVWGLWPSRRRD